MQTINPVTGTKTDELQRTPSLNSNAPNATRPFQGISQLSVEQTKQVSGGNRPGSEGEIIVND